MGTYPIRHPGGAPSKPKGETECIESTALPIGEKKERKVLG